MTIDKQIEQAFTELAQLSKERALEVIERVENKPSDQQLTIIKFELEMMRDTYLQENKNSLDLKDITSRFLIAAQSIRG